MGSRGILIKSLAVIGTGLLWLPLLAPVFFTAAAAAGGDGFRFDYLMPAELFPAAVAGALPLLLAAFLARSRRSLIAAGLAAAAALLIGGQVWAVASGLATGAIKAEGWPWALVLASLAGYALGLLTSAVGGLLLLVDLFRPEPGPA